MMVLLVAAALGSIPKVVPATAEISDYPEKALREHLTGMTRAEVVVGPDGDALRCDLVGSSGSNLLDIKACRMMMLRSKYEPGRDEAGIPIAGVRRLDIEWRIADRAYRYPQWTDMTLSVDQLPKIYKLSIATLRVVLDTKGRVETCETDKSSGVGQLDRLACKTLSATTFTPVHDATGTSLRAVRDMSVAFVTASQR